VRDLADRLRAFGQIPVPDTRSARFRLATLVAVAFVLVAADIQLLSPRIPAPARTPDAPPVAEAPAPAEPAPTPASIVTGRDIAAAKRAARRFLTGGYLDYAYGRRVERITAATRELRAALAAAPPRVTPAQRRRHARILAMQTEGAQAGDVPVLVTLDDGTITSSLTVRVQLHRRSWVVADIAL
jgi:hypothetical protein